jgi:hypothetical protein
LKVSPLIAVACYAAAISANATTAFSDGDFSLSDYAFQNFTNNQSVSITTNASKGNPGSSLEVAITAGRGNSEGHQYFFNNSFLYDISASGAIESLEFSIDQYISSTLTLQTHGAGLLILQNDNIYTYSVALPATENIFLHASAKGIRAHNFSLITDKATATSNKSIHPDFTKGSLQFGFATGWTATGSLPRHTTIERLDNYSVTVSQVPESSSLLLVIFGALTVFGSQRRFLRAQINAYNKSISATSMRFLFSPCPLLRALA